MPRRATTGKIPMIWPVAREKLSVSRGPADERLCSLGNADSYDISATESTGTMPIDPQGTTEDEIMGPDAEGSPSLHPNAYEKA